MAKIISNMNFNQIGADNFSVWKVAVLGAASGLLYFLINMVLGNFLSLTMAGCVSMILTMAAGIAVMIRQRMVQPLIVAVSVGVLLWALPAWYDGLSSFEVLLWSMFLFSAAYILFSGLINKMRLIFALIVIAIVIIFARIAISL